MDPVWSSSVLVTLLTGIFSLLTLRIQKRQDKIIAKIDEQTFFIDKEKKIRQKLVQAEKKRDIIVEQITILSLKVNIYNLKANPNVDATISDDLKETAEELEESYKEASEEIKDVSKEYEMLISVSNDLQKDFEGIAHRLKGGKK